MPITLYFAQSMGGDAYACRLETYYRTITYEVPNYVLDDEFGTPGILHETSDFRAAMVTDPVDYLTGSDFSDQFCSDANSADLLRDKLGDFNESGDGKLCIVLHLRQDLGSFLADEGQCRRINGEIALINCGEPHVPAIDARRDTINTLLTAVKMAFDITDGFVKRLDESICRTDDGEFVHWRNVDLSAAVGSVIRRIGNEDLTAKIADARDLCDQINQAMTTSPPVNPKLKQDFPERLADLMDGLQLEPSHDDAYRRLWYLQLWHRAKKFGKAVDGEEYKERLMAERDHRNAIAHPGVERADGRLSFRDLITSRPSATTTTNSAGTSHPTADSATVCQKSNSIGSLPSERCRTSPVLRWRSASGLVAGHEQDAVAVYEPDLAGDAFVQPDERAQEVGPAEALVDLRAYQHRKQNHYQDRDRALGLTAGL